MGIYSKVIDQQKLQAAWEKVRKNKPACGVDNITWEQFDEQKKENIKQLNIELLQHEYRCLPVKVVTIFKNNKAREIALYSMRDKVVQQSLATELNRIFDEEFSYCTYAYRPNKSALIALEEIEKEVKKVNRIYFLKIDISHYFDTINCVQLRQMLQKKIKEEDVIDLIIKNSTTESVSEQGEVVEKRLGIYQGSSIAPILSNVYLKDFDEEMQRICPYYLRYSDDMLILANTEREIQDIYQIVKLWMEKKELSLNEKKTKIGNIQNGFEFLGYSYNKKGKAVSEKAENGLQERLETMWFQNINKELEVRLDKAAEILEGWEQYFRGERDIKSMYEFSAVFYMMKRRKCVQADFMEKQRKSLKNLNRELCQWLSGIWADLGRDLAELREFEDFYEVNECDVQVDVSEENIHDLLEQYRKVIEFELEENLVEIMQLYTDCRCYNRASKFMEIIQKKITNKELNKSHFIPKKQEEEQSLDTIVLSREELELYFEHFAGREDTYAVEELDRNGRRVCTQVMEPLTIECIKEHLLGTKTIATYVQRNNATAKYFVIDIDISKKTLLILEKNREPLSSYMEKAAMQAERILKELQKLGLKGYLEESGYRGYHIWILFGEWVPVRYLNLFQELLENLIGDIGSEFSVEYFPNKSKVKNEHFGQCIKLPYGIHVKSEARSCFLENDFTKVKNPGMFFTEMATYNLNALKKIISSTKRNDEVSVVDCHLSEDLSILGDLTEDVQILLKKCNLMRYLCFKAKNTGYLTHFERLSLLYVFGHMGDEGAEFLHQIMGYTLNYQYHVTQKFIARIPEKPISCIKLREQYKKVTAEYGCSCNFNRIKGCYPSPVLHVIKSSGSADGNITVPTSRTVSKEKQKNICEELNLNKQVEGITSKILEFKKQKRGIDKNITKLEKELERLFDEAGIDCIEVEYGMLVRRKLETGYEWIVEI